MNEVKVGILAFLAIASLVTVSLTITANKASFGEFVEYKTILDDATGIYENSSIKVAGIVAGRIKSISLSGSQALLTFEVLNNIKITKFSRLRIKSVGFLGDKYIDIFLGNPDAPRLEAGQMVPADAGAGFEQLGKDASEILKDVKVIAKVIKDSLYTEDQQNAIKQIVTQINEFSHNANEISKTLKRVLDGNEN
ncbi:MAG: MlaD family protein, partial [Bdellovibrionota bacterium]|nr:MlaD family protein [Bdellovibrionota bacterium]